MRSGHQKYPVSYAYTFHARVHWRCLPAVHGSLLVLEDDDELGTLLDGVLTMAGYDAFLAGTRSDALNHLPPRR